MDTRKERRIFILVSFLALVLCYLPLFIAGKRVDPDAGIIWGNLDKFHGPLDYLQGLLQFRTIDLQPVRDLSFLIDRWFWHSFHLDVSIFQNLFFWLVALYLLEELSGYVFPELQKKTRYALLGLFAVYPLFNSILSWGVARKHLLAMVFILLAWRALLKGRWVLSTVFYVLSLLSQPIALLFPVWSLWWTDRKKAALSLAVMVVFAFVTMAYYKNSDVFRMLYEQKTFLTDPGVILLALGHYTWRIVFPFFPASSYTLDHYSVLAGLAVLMLLGYWLTRRKSKNDIVWVTLIFFPLLPVLSSPEMLSDTYLLLPATGAFFFIMRTLTEKNFSPPLVATGVFALLFAGTNFYEARFWTNEVSFLRERNFSRRPNCNSAVKLTVESFRSSSSIDPEVREYLAQHDCRDIGEMSLTKGLLFLEFRTAIVYTDPVLTYEQKKEELEKIKDLYFIPRLALSALAITHNDQEYGLGLVNDLLKKYDSIHWPQTYFDPVAKIIDPVCPECRRITEHFTKDAYLPFW